MTDELVVYADTSVAEARLTAYIGTEMVAMRRPSDESIGQALARLALTLAKKRKKKNKKAADGNQQQQAEHAASAILLDAATNREIDTGAVTHEAWSSLDTGELFLLMTLPGEAAGALRLAVSVNPPTVLELTISTKQPTFGSPLMPAAELENAAGGATWEWLREDFDGADAAAGAPKFTVVGSERLYVPDAADVGRLLRVRCTPLGAGGRTGRAATHFLLRPVAEGTAPAIVALRGGLTPCFTEPPKLRLVSYNILSDGYCTNRASDVLYPYCPRGFRELEYRTPLLMREIQSYHADLLCLQECDEKLYRRLLEPVYSTAGYACHYTGKGGKDGGSVREGCALLVNGRRLAVESVQDIDLRDAVTNCSAMESVLAALPHLRDIVSARVSTIAQIAVLVDVDHVERRLVVANTHLFYHPHAAHVRLMQIVALADLIAAQRDLISSRGLTPTVMVLGDFNSTPDGPIRYLLGDTIEPSDPVWANAVSFKWGKRFHEVQEEANGNDSGADGASSARVLEPGEEGGVVADEEPLEADGGNVDVVPSAAGVDEWPEGAGPPTLACPLRLKSACGFPAFSNYTLRFTDLLDYMLVEPELEVENVLPFPVREDMAEKDGVVGWPNTAYPSDHVALVADVVLRN